MKRFAALALLAVLLSSCSKPAEKPPDQEDTSSNERQTSGLIRPEALLQTGEHPLWFQFNEDGPLHIGSIEEAFFSRALIPWPLALYANGFLAREGSLLLAVNRDGFLHFTPNRSGIIMHRIPGGDFWQRYTVGSFFFFDQKPVTLLYLDDIFIETEDTVPLQRLWTYNLFSPEALPFNILFLDKFAAEEGWNIESLRYNSDNSWHYKAVSKKDRPEIRLLRSYGEETEEISAGVFRNLALPLPLEKAPVPLRGMLSAVFEKSQCTSASVASPDFPHAIDFAANREGESILGFYSDKGGEQFLLTAKPNGDAFYLTTGSGEISIHQFSLPSLPETFAYTGIGLAGDSIIALWEERQGYSIGAAGFMAISLELALRPSNT